VNKSLRKPAAVFVVVLFVIGSLVVAHLGSKGPLEKYKAQLRASGEKLTVEELIPPRLQPEQNSAETLIRAGALSRYDDTFFNSNPPPAMHLVAPGKAMIGWAQPYLHYDGSNTWEEAEAALQLSEPALELLRRTIEQPHFDFALDYKQGMTLIIPHLMTMRKSTQLLSAAALCDLHRHDSASAVTNTRAMLALIKGWKEDRLVISEMVRNLIAGFTYPVTWELFQSPDLSEEQLAAVQRDWAEIDFLQTTELAFQMERAYVSQNAAKLRTSNSPFSSFTLHSGSGSSGGSGDWWDQLADRSQAAWRGTKLKTKETLWKVSLSYSDELRALKGQQATVEAVRQIQTNNFFHDALQEQKEKFKALGLGLGQDGDSYLWDKDPADFDPRSLLSQGVSFLSRFLERLMRLETSRQLAITALALKRYHLRHASYPSELSALVPDFLAAVPRDPVDGKPLRYRLNPDGTFLLYSIGENATDDGGDPQVASSPGFFWEKGRDWVWPNPATEAEIQAYDDKLRGH